MAWHWCLLLVPLAAFFGFLLAAMFSINKGEP